MPSNYVFTETSPSTTTYIRSGRGGAGNTFRASDIPSTAATSSSTSQTTSSTLAPRRFFSGIGGAGNVHEADQLRPALLRSLESSAEQNPPWATAAVAAPEMSTAARPAMRAASPAPRVMPAL
ncbi:hypothetical protein PT974_05581 [Cladobotryum mycophilum]|uniref:Uncharacterized protein n=1 Tax=Cladobotryum mycophilum TaxID=491253 RepID=A0ABR0SKD1_9HYPO